MNPSSNIDQLKVAAEAGNIDLLYAVIQDDPSILENIDSKQFVETPLHIAASRGHLRFAAEIMNLKPSFALKLNQQGFSPIHLAIQNNQKRMVFLLVDMNCELVRVKGREGWTPIHFA
ncbi:ankyrin repeat-containing protein, partial [Trifolium medium]|nr:ankyrin repeat-containing protein [Trifolium medium]